MADDSETPGASPADKTAPRRRAARAKAEDAPATPRRTPRKAQPKAQAKSDTPAKADEPAKAQATDAPKRRAPAKPRAAKRPTPPARARKAKDASAVEKATEKVGGKWGAAAIAGGIAAAGVAAAALVSLRGSSAKDKTLALPKPGAKAHQPDGTDSSKSFGAGIADENTIPDKK